MKTQRKVATLAATLAATLITFGSLAGGANAAIVYAYYDGTISESGFAEADIGDSLRYVVALDNGGSSVNSQTWLASDVQSVTFYANSGAINVEFGIEAGDVTGSFTSDAGGDVTGVGAFLNLNLVNSSNIVAPDYRLYINGNNDVFFTSGINLYNGISEVDVSNNRIASNWTLSATNPVPEPSSALLLGLGALGSAFRRRRTSKVEQAGGSTRCRVESS